MRHSEIEAWALRVIEQVRRKQPNEDARVELKVRWPDDTYKAARQIAAHANPAGGEPVLWLIGVDQHGNIQGAEYRELANWYKQVESHFDELAPSVIDVNIPLEGKTVVALLLNTERRPYIVKTVTGSGPVSHEVPWRGTTSTRSAKRSELLGMLAVARRPPKWEVLSGELDVERIEQPQLPVEYNQRWKVRLEMYVMPEDDSRICIPLHHCGGTLAFPDFGMKSELRDVRFAGHGMGAGYVKATSDELIIDGPGKAFLYAEARSTYQGLLPHTDGYLSVTLPSIGGAQPAPIQVVFTYNKSVSHWTFGEDKQ